MAQDSLKILVAGDSFAAAWPETKSGWPSLLGSMFNVTNVAQAGVGEYKILKQIKNVNLNLFDLVIVSHTSPFRIHTPTHPIERAGLHQHCDLIYTDLEANFNVNNKSLTTALNWFKYHYDEDYQNDIYTLLRKEINHLITIPYLCLDHNPITSKYAFEENRIDLSHVWAKNRGDVNHYTDQGNLWVFNEITNTIKELI
jgi:hypothetical protein